MNREIKLRAWDKDSKSFVKRVSFDRIPTTNTREGFRLKTRFELSQAIGLNDKNGKPIYVGDILKWNYRDGNGGFMAKVIYGHFEVGRDSWDMPLFTVGYFLAFVGLIRMINMKSSVINSKLLN